MPAAVITGRVAALRLAEDGALAAVPPVGDDGGAGGAGQIKARQGVEVVGADLDVPDKAALEADVEAEAVVDLGARDVLAPAEDRNDLPVRDDAQHLVY